VLKFEKVRYDLHPFESEVEIPKTSIQMQLRKLNGKGSTGGIYEMT
jgi:hypothetical protein